MDAATLVMMVLLAVIVFGGMVKLLWNLISGNSSSSDSVEDVSRMEDDENS